MANATEIMNASYAALQEGNITGALLGGASILGDFFYIIIIMIIAIGVHNHTESPEATGYVIFLLAMMGFLWNLAGKQGGISIYVIFILIMVGGLAMPIYNLLKRE